MNRRLTLPLLLLLTLVSVFPGQLRGNDNEVVPDKSKPCFPGAYYRKAVSSTDRWTGIEAVITLPTFVPDPARLDAKGRSLDNASIYLGGRAKETEIDAGVCWEVIREEDGTVSKVGKAFRPFWRNKKWFSGPAKPEYYFYPGDTIRIRIVCPEQDKLEMTIDLLSRNDDTRVVSEKPLSTLQVKFDAPDFDPKGMQEFKRVNAIDQRGNEGKPVVATDAKLLETIWERVTLHRGEQQLEMIPARFTDMRCPSQTHFAIDAGHAEVSAEIVSIFGTAPVESAPTSPSTNP